MALSWNKNFFHKNVIPFLELAFFRKHSEEYTILEEV